MPVPDEVVGSSGLEILLRPRLLMVDLEDGWFEGRKNKKIMQGVGVERCRCGSRCSGRCSGEEEEEEEKEKSWKEAGGVDFLHVAGVQKVQ